MNEASKPDTAGLHKDRHEYQAEVTANNASDAERLGHLAARHEVHADVHGNLLSPGDLKEIASGNTAYKE